MGQVDALPLRIRPLLYRGTCKLPLPIRRHILYTKSHRRLPNLRNPKRFSEKTNWRIVFDRRELLAWTCDKQRMKEMVAQISGLYIPQTLWFGTDVRELGDVDLPDWWVLKPNHRSQAIYFGRGQAPEAASLTKITRDWMRDVQAKELGEWAYSRARPAMIAEEWIGGHEPPEDYKFFVFNGEPLFVQVDTTRFTGHRRSFYRIPDWEPVDVVHLYPPAPPVPKPAHLNEMVRIASGVGSPFDFMRVDLYDTERHGVTFGETSPYPEGGLGPFQPAAFDIELGRAWTLPQSRT
ncbi:MAG TPA: ATP-grasp fold amidoligase family protein [Pseudonocardia sp.]